MKGEGIETVPIGLSRLSAGMHQNWESPDSAAPIHEARRRSDVAGDARLLSRGIGKTEGPLA